MVAMTLVERWRVSSHSALDAAGRNQQAKEVTRSVFRFWVLPCDHLSSCHTQCFREHADVDISVFRYQYPVTMLEPDFSQDGPTVRRA
ncbi:hypothetical protein A9995_10535 [Erythrobacter sp. QSSC1-22B]|nr:hypothetical protein A9995_10535 [Erythrobacter sp. QSSC1-22B]